MRNKLLQSLLLLLVIGLLAGCAQPAAVPTERPVVETQAPLVTEAPAPEPTEAPASAAFTVTDALGRVVEFDTLPTRITVAGKAGFMISNAVYLFSEAPERVVAYVAGSQTPNDFISTVYPEALSLLKLETTSGPEQIAPIKPDVVLLKSYLKDSLGDPLEQLGIKVVYLSLETIDEINRDIRILGSLFGNPQRAEELVQMYALTSAKVTDITAGISEEEKPTVLMLQYSDKGGEIAFKVPPVDWLQSSIVTMAGGKPAWSDVTTDGWTTITFEQIATWNPQVIFMIDYKGNAVDVVKNLKADEGWMLLDAVKNDQLFAVPVDFQSWDQPDTRWILGLTWVAAKLHPDLFSGVDMTSEIKSFYASFYGLDDEIINTKIMPLVMGDL